MPDLSIGRYVRYRLRLDTLPDRTEGPPAPAPRPGPESSTDRVPVPEPVDEDRSWWERA